MALQPCRECGAQVSTEAVACPNCGIGEPTRGAGVGQFKGPVNRYRTKGVRPPKKKVNWSIGLLPVTVGVLLLKALVVGLILIWNASMPTNSTESTYTPHVHAEHLQSDAKRVHGQLHRVLATPPGVAARL